MGDDFIHILGVSSGLLLLGALIFIFFVLPAYRERQFEKTTAAAKALLQKPATVAKVIVEEEAAEDQARIDDAVAAEDSAAQELADLGNARKR